jgi:hypothetical protein
MHPHPGRLRLIDGRQDAARAATRNSDYGVLVRLFVFGLKTKEC